MLKALAVLAEKTLATYVQVWVTLLVAGASLDANVAQEAAVAAIPAGLTVIANGLPEVPQGSPFWLDLIYRTTRTYVVSFIGLLVAVPIFRLDLGVGRAALLGAIPAALAVAKGLLASKFGSPTPALLPSTLDV